MSAAAAILAAGPSELQRTKDRLADRAIAEATESVGQFDEVVRRKVMTLNILGGVGGGGGGEGAGGSATPHLPGSPI